MDPNSIPHHFKCPISMELMLDPVTVATGVTYERTNIERWLFTYKKSTCPATMQRLSSFDLTPNLTLKRLIDSWSSSSSSSSSSTPTCMSPTNIGHEISILLHRVETSPFKAGALQRLRRMIGFDEDAKEELVRRGGVEVLGGVLHKVLEDSGEFEAFEACEEVVGVIRLLLLREDKEVMFLMKKESLGAMVIMMQRGSAEARLHALIILQKIVRTSRNRSKEMGEQGIEFFTSLLDLLSDEISAHASAAALDVLIEILTSSKKAQLKAVEAGAVRLVIELLPEAGRHKCEKLLLLLKLLCKCPEGRAAFVDHALGIAVVSKKIMRVSEAATKLAIKVLWLVSSSLPARKVLDELMVVGAVKKMLALLHVGGTTSTKEMVINIIKTHGRAWQHHPCYPCELKDYFKSVDNDPSRNSGFILSRTFS